MQDQKSMELFSGYKGQPNFEPFEKSYLKDNSKQILPPLLACASLGS